MNIVFTTEGVRRGYVAALPIALGLSVFGMVYGPVASQKA